MRSSLLRFLAFHPIRSGYPQHKFSPCTDLRCFRHRSSPFCSQFLLILQAAAKKQNRAISTVQLPARNTRFKTYALAFTFSLRPVPLPGTTIDGLFRPDRQS